MSKNDKEKVIRGMALCVIGLIVGYGLMALPFHLNDSLTPLQMKIVFCTEFIIYSIIAISVCLIHDSKKGKKRKDDDRKCRRKNKEQQYENSINMLKIHTNDDFAA